jgi:ParB family chromosome partitioning protein
MSSTQRGLGKGFDALIPTQLVEDEFDPTAAQSQSGERVSADHVYQLDPAIVDPNPHQPRLDFDEEALQGLAESIKTHGILQPMVVTDSGNGRYELIAGERRLRAAKLAGLDKVPAIVRSFSEQQKLELALIENLQRQDLNPMETATSYRKLVDQFGMGLVEIGKRVGLDDSTISNTMRLLNLPLEAKRAVADGTISEGHARQILSLPNTEKQLALLDMIIKNGWTVRQAEAFARDFKKDSSTTETAHKSAATSNELTKTLEEYLGTKVALLPTAKGGKLVIEYYSEEELNRIFEAIKQP